MNAAVWTEVADGAEIAVALRVVLGEIGCGVGGWKQKREEVRSRLAHFKLIFTSRKGDLFDGNIHIPGASADAHCT